MTVFNTVGASGRNYATLALAIAALQTLGTFTDNEVVAGYNDSQTGGYTTGFNPTSTIAISGINTNGFTLTIRPALSSDPGSPTWQGAAQNPSVQTNAFSFNTSNGLSLGGAIGYGPIISISGVNNVTITGFQIRNTAAGANGAGHIITVGGASANCNILGNILDWATTTSGLTNDSVVSFQPSSNGAVFANNLITVSGGSNARGVDFLNVSGTVLFADNTVVAPSDKTSSSYGINLGNYATNGAVTAQGNVVCGFSMAYHLGTNTFNAASDYNAADTTMTGMPGTHNRPSLTYSSQFRGVTSSALDYRPPTSGSSIVDAGTTVSGITTDFAGTTRPQGSAPDIGAWELVTGSPSVPDYVEMQGTFPIFRRTEMIGYDA